MNKFAQTALDVASDQAVSGTVLTAITDLGCPVAASDRCYFDFYILFQHTLITESLKLDLAFPTSPTNIVYNISIPNAVAGADALISSFNRAAVGVLLVSANTDYMAHIHGVLINGANAGILQPKVSSTAGLGTVTVRAGSSAVMTNL